VKGAVEGEGEEEEGEGKGEEVGGLKVADEGGRPSWASWFETGGVGWDEEGERS